MLVYILLFSVSFSLQANNKIVLCIENQDETNLYESLLSTVLRSAQQVGLTVQLVRLPWLRCQLLVKSGELHGLLLMIKTPERQLEFAFPNESNFILQFEYPIIVKKNGVFDTESLKNQSMFHKDQSLNIEVYRAMKKVGLSAPFGYISYQFLEQQNLLSPFNTDLDTALKLIENERLDGFVIARDIARELLQVGDNADKLRITSGSIMKKSLYAPMNLDYYQQNEEQVSSFWRALHKNRPNQ
ncbi:hypothetical protein [uncultured Paraglaciecola sp.]|uniref:substrate-binding periplasmic protein n=1 Tax=uncultured Paraglaciecola sp. TaxID=1765024 RepID=UPI0030DA36E1|tara:strand:+ start:61148 stop:61876 length:729 start_codon:yes stop_codon:yes gene_type:complete